MKRHKKLMRRSVAMVLLTIFSTGAVTYAALQSPPATLTGNSIETASAGLQVSTDGTTYGGSKVGFDFGSVIPGGSPTPTAGAPFWLKSTGTAPVSIKMSVASTVSNPNNIDLSKVTVWLTTVGGGSGAKPYTLQSLVDAQTTGGVDIGLPSLGFGGSQQFKLQVSMATDAISDSSASLGNIDFGFMGVAQTN